MNLPHAITEKLGTPNSTTPPYGCRIKDMECDFTHPHANRITTQYVVYGTNDYLVKQSTYCNHRGCSSRQQKIWNLDEPFDWNTNPPIVEELK
tara:strand:+ start:567 stop:845 length:279 start_codon:yes stop_codon:yes gene_type:complete